MSDPRMQGQMVLPTDEGNVVVRIFGWTAIEEVSVTHPAPGTELGVCTAWFDPSTHTIVQDVPLTVTPSLDCPECGWHKTITEGKVKP